jgi:hypothetical protein
MAQAIQAKIGHYGLDSTIFEQIDRITNLCDRIAFDFCFKAPAKGEVRIYPRNNREEEVTVGYQPLRGNPYARYGQVRHLHVTRAHDGFLPFATAELHLFSAF